ncbi:MAG: response regulator transcription factor [Actinomycetota bacterium]|nr:response regulator transcription factor [Actinomycetota bacterium]
MLLVDDDPVLADMVMRYLQRDGYEVEWMADGTLVVDCVTRDAPSLVILDLLLPDRDGREICREVRRTSNVPILMLTALGGMSDCVAGFEAGADDYLAKPFSLRELVLRVGAILRRTQAAGGLSERNDRIVHDGDLTVDTSSGEVRRSGDLLTLTGRERDLLLFLLRHPQDVFSRQQLLEQVWGWSYGDPSTVTVQVRRLREKIETNPNQPERILTVWGVGYRYKTVEP